MKLELKNKNNETQEVIIPEWMQYNAIANVSYDYFKYNKASIIKEDLEIEDEYIDDDYFKYNSITQILNDLDIWFTVESIFDYEVKEYIKSHFTVEDIE